MNPRHGKILFVLLTLAVLLLGACVPITPEPAGPSEGIEKTIYVGPTTVDCVGVAPQQCLLVKENPEDDYSMFYDTIEGFEHEEGYEYTLRILETPVANPPADASSLQWTLIEIVEQTPVGAALEGTLWSLESLVDEQGETFEVLADTEITARFENGALAGSSGCNQYSGMYTAEGNNLTLGENFALTMMACPDPIMAQEQAYFVALGSVATYEITDSQLQLADADGNVILIYTAVEPAALTGTQWEVTFYNNGRGGFTSVLLDTTLTALFGEDGTVSGLSGCNNYTASYEIAEGTIVVGPAATTRKMCAAPEGIMEQESEYLAALQSAATFVLEGDTLDLFLADGARAVTYVAQ